jgi:hypothetical protein
MVDHWHHWMEQEMVYIKKKRVLKKKYVLGFFTTKNKNGD